MFNMKRIFLFFMLSVYSGNGIAGHESGDGGGTIARLLSYAKLEIVKALPNLLPKVVEFDSPDLENWYASNYSQMLQDVRNIEFVPMDIELSDSFYGYDTWIRLNVSQGFVVEYNPSVKRYQKLIGAINLRYRGVKYGAEPSPSLVDITEYLLHEIGHKYGLKEHDAWRFAQTLVKRLNIMQPIMPTKCHMSLLDEQKDVVLDSSHLEHSIKQGIFIARLELLTHMNEIYWSITVNNGYRDLGVHHMAAPIGTPISGQIMVAIEEFATVYCK
jgi:hypothetical protein